MITAHPTEVRRKTILDVLDQIADLLDERAEPSIPGRDDSTTSSPRVLMLWQTAILRLSKLHVRDEINEAIRYYEASLFEVVPTRPASTAGRRPRRGHRRHADATHAITMGSWIGGDRDGNPFVTDEVMRYAIGRQTATALEHHLAAVHRLSHNSR